MTLSRDTERKQKDEVLVYATAWMDFENVLRRERSQTPKATYCMIPFICHVQSRPMQRDRKQTRGCLGLGRGRGRGLIAQ